MYCYFSVDDLKKVIKSLNFDDERMEALRVLAPRTILIKTKKSIIIDALDFDDEKQRADGIISAITELTEATAGGNSSTTSTTGAGAAAGAAAGKGNGKGDGEAGRRILLEEARKRIKDSDEGMPEHTYKLLKVFRCCVTHVIVRNVLRVLHSQR